MKKIISIIIIVVSLLSVTAIADETTLAFDVDGYSLEDLRIIKEQVDSRIAELERQWAIEHGDRTITFEESEITLFTNKTKKIKPIITRVIDDAPQKTTILWSTSDKSIAKVDSEGTVTAVAYGDATITATAKDNDCIFGSIVVHVVLPVSKVSAQERKSLYCLTKTRRMPKWIYMLIFLLTMHIIKRLHGNRQRKPWLAGQIMAI
jgi:hypothetical protein